MLGINVETIILSKMGPYLDTLSAEQRQVKLAEYKEAAQDTIQGTIDEAEAYIEAINNTCVEIATQVPLTIAQISSLALLLDPTAKVTQLTTIMQSVGNQKDQLSRAKSQLASLKNILSQLGVQNTIVDTLATSIETAAELIDTIPSTIPENNNI